MRRNLLLSTLALAGLHAPAVPGVKSIETFKVATMLGWPSMWDFPAIRRGGSFNIPRYNQRKARKLARSSGIHPANAKRA